MVIKFLYQLCTLCMGKYFSSISDHLVCPIDLKFIGKWLWTSYSWWISHCYFLSYNYIFTTKNGSTYFCIQAGNTNWIFDINYSLCFKKFINVFNKSFFIETKSQIFGPFHNILVSLLITTLNGSSFSFKLSISTLSIETVEFL